MVCLHCFPKFSLENHWEHAAQQKCATLNLNSGLELNQIVVFRHHVVETQSSNLVAFLKFEKCFKLQETILSFQTHELTYSRHQDRSESKCREGAESKSGDGNRAWLLLENIVAMDPRVLLPAWRAFATTSRCEDSCCTHGHINTAQWSHYLHCWTRIASPRQWWQAVVFQDLARKLSVTITGLDRRPLYSQNPIIFWRCGHRTLTGLWRIVSI